MPASSREAIANLRMCVSLDVKSLIFVSRVDRNGRCGQRDG